MAKYYVKKCAAKYSQFVESMFPARGKIITIKKRLDHDCCGFRFGWYWYDYFCVKITSENKHKFKGVEKINDL